MDARNKDLRSLPGEPSSVPICSLSSIQTTSGPIPMSELLQLEDPFKTIFDALLADLVTKGFVDEEVTAGSSAIVCALTMRGASFLSTKQVKIDDQSFLILDAQFPFIPRQFRPLNDGNLSDFVAYQTGVPESQSSALHFTALGGVTPSDRLQITVDGGLPIAIRPQSDQPFLVPRGASVHIESQRLALLESPDVSQTNEISFTAQYPDIQIVSTWAHVMQMTTDPVVPSAVEIRCSALDLPIELGSFNGEVLPGEVSLEVISMGKDYTLTEIWVEQGGEAKSYNISESVNFMVHRDSAVRYVIRHN